MWPKPPECFVTSFMKRPAALLVFWVFPSVFFSLAHYQRSWISVELSFIKDLGHDIDQICVFSTKRVLCPAVSSRRESSEYLSRVAQVKPSARWPLTFPFAFLSFGPSLCMGIAGLPWWHRRGVWGHLTIWPVPDFRCSGLSHKNDISQLSSYVFKWKFQFQWLEGIWHYINIWFTIIYNNCMNLFFFLAIKSWLCFMFSNSSDVLFLSAIHLSFVIYLIILVIVQYVAIILPSLNLQNKS